MSQSASVDPYLFDPAFERAIVYLAATRPSFYQRIGYLLDDTALGAPQAKFIIESLHMLAVESLKLKRQQGQTIGTLDRVRGSTPSSRAALLQSLRNRITEEGRIKLETVVAAAEWLGEEPTESEDDLVERLKPTIKRRAQQTAMEALADEYSNRKDSETTQRWLDVAKTVGAKRQIAQTISLGPQVIDALQELKRLQRQRIGIPEIDQYLEGGMPQGQLGMAIGGPGDGKSMFLIQTAAEFLLAGRNVAFVSLELPSSLLATRLLANLTGFQISDIVSRGLDEEAVRLCSEAPNLGVCIFQDFTPQGTYVNEIIEWVQQEEKDRGIQIHAVVVDYADKLISKKADRLYEAMRFVYEDLRLFAEKSTPKRWVWTASQATRKETIRSKKDGEKRVERTGLQHAADSQEKVRVADIVMGLTREDDTYVIKIDKNRTGEAGRVFEGMPVDFSRGRVVMLPRPGFGAANPNATSEWARVQRPIGGPAAAPTTRSQPGQAPAPPVMPPTAVPLPELDAASDDFVNFEW